MRNANITGKLLLASLVVSLFPGCITVTNVKDVTADRGAYMATKFDPGTLSPVLAKKVPQDASGKGFGHLTITMEAKSEGSDGKTESWINTVTFVDAGHGFVQRMTESSNNDIPYNLAYSLTYKGIMDLRWQTVPLRGTVAGPLNEVKDTTRFDSLPETVGKEFVVDYLIAPDYQIANFRAYQKSCKATRALEAGSLHAKLPGPALELECQILMNNVVQSRSKWVLIQQYGLAIQIENVDSSNKSTVRVADVKD